MAKRTPGKRNVIAVEVNDPLHSVLEERIRITGMAKRTLLQRVISWYLKQPDVIQTEIEGHIPKSVRAVVARHVLEEMLREDTEENKQ